MMNTSFAPVVTPRLARGGALRQAAQRVRQAGRFDDTELVHLNPGEKATLERIYGPPRVNPATGLEQHGFFDDILGGIGSAVSGVGDALFGGGGSGGGIGDILSSVLGIFGGGPSAKMGAPGGYANSVYGPSQASGAQGQPGGGGFNPAGISKLINLAGGLASFVGALNQSRSASNQQKKMLHRQNQLQQQNSQHVDYPIGTSNPVYSSAAPFSSSEAGLNPSYDYLHYDEGGRVGDANDSEDLGDGSLDGSAREVHAGGWGRWDRSATDRTPWAADRPSGGQNWFGHGPTLGPIMGTSRSPLPTMLPPQQPNVQFPPNPGAGMQSRPSFTPPPGMPMGPGYGGNGGAGGFGQRLANGFRRGGAPRGPGLRAGALSHPQGQVNGPGTGQSDDVPAYLSRDEYVVPADVVSHLGDGSSSAGAQVLDKKIAEVRKKRTGNTKFPPKAGALSLGGR